MSLLIVKEPIPFSSCNHVAAVARPAALIVIFLWALPKPWLLCFHFVLPPAQAKRAQKKKRARLSPPPLHRRQGDAAPTISAAPTFSFASPSPSPSPAMGISHPLSDEYDALRGAVLSPERTPPSSPPPPPPNHHCLEHEVSRMDTLAGIAIKYGVEISDIKRANGLVTDSQMFAHKTLLIPLPGRLMRSSVRLNGSGQRTKRAWAPSHQQNRDAIDPLDSSKYGQQGVSPAMDNLQRYYGLTSQKGNTPTVDCSTEMSVYRKGGFQSNLCETLLDSLTAPATKGTDRSWEFEAPVNGFLAMNGANRTKSNGPPKPKKDGSMRRRQKVEADSNAADTQDDFLADPIKAIKSLLPRPISSIRLNMDTGSPDSSQKSSTSFLNGFRSVRKSPSAPNFADAENGVSMWSNSKWSFNHESFTRPLLDGLPKPVAGRRTKAALD